MKLRRPETRLCLAIIVGLILAATPRQVAACSCAAMTPHEAAATADAAFTGTVVATAPLPRPVGEGFAGMHDTVYTFAVDGVVKGELPAEVSIVGGSSGAACGMAFGVDTRHLVFASLEGNNLATNLCSGNVALAGDEAGPLPTRLPKSTPSATDPEPPLAVIIVGGIVLLLTGVSFAAFRRTAR